MQHRILAEYNHPRGGWAHGSRARPELTGRALARITPARRTAAEVALLRGHEVSQQPKFSNWFKGADFKGQPSQPIENARNIINAALNARL